MSVGACTRNTEQKCARKMTGKLMLKLLGEEESRIEMHKYQHLRVNLVFKYLSVK